MVTAGGARTLTGQSQVGGRFWALANDTDDEPEDAVPDRREVQSPTPSDLICESLQLGYTEEEVAQNLDGFIPSSDHAWSGLGDHTEDKIEGLPGRHRSQLSVYSLAAWVPVENGKSLPSAGASLHGRTGWLPDTSGYAL
ncbi:hypothetical protein D1007_15882 [Hordeum vulgare]|nr:hypothetical protein D1007_15882 [Hordeum vulgare]